jgi:hypothetical protein
MFSKNLLSGLAGKILKILNVRGCQRFPGFRRMGLSRHVGVMALVIVRRV